LITLTDLQLEKDRIDYLTSLQTTKRPWQKRKRAGEKKEGVKRPPREKVKAEACIRLPVPMTEHLRWIISIREN